MDLKEFKDELEGLKNDLQKDFNAKSQLDIQTAIEAFEKSLKAKNLKN